MKITFNASRLADTARHQGGLWTRAQARDVGVSYRVIRRRVSNGRWYDLGHGVFCSPELPRGYPQQLWRAHLAAGPASVISHEAAAVLHSMEGFGGAPVVITRPHSSSTRLGGVTVHQIDDVADAHRIRLDGLPVTSPTRTIVDLAAICGRGRLELAVESELSRGRMTVASLSALLAELARPGKPGVLLLGRVLDRQAGRRPGSSALEHAVEPVLRRLGLPFVAEVPLPARGDVPGMVDFAVPTCLLIIEVDGRRWHDRRSAMVRDRDRDNAAAAAGWLTLRFMWEHVFTDPDGVLETLRATCTERLRLLRGAG